VDDPQLREVLSQKPEGPNRGTKWSADSPPESPHLPSAGEQNEVLIAPVDPESLRKTLSDVVGAENCQLDLSHPAVATDHLS
jgi:hypothetical protein